MSQTPSSSSSSQRLPSFRDMNSIQKVLLNKTKPFNKKTYVPNLFLSRNVQPKAKEENPGNLKKEPTPKESRKSRREQKLLPAVETLAPASDTSRDVISLRSKSKIVSASVGVKVENMDRINIRDIFSKQLPEKFEGISLSSSQDLPVTIPEPRPTTSTNSTKKIEKLLTDILKSDGGESPLFLLKTPKYIPAVLDDSKNHPKITLKDDKVGYKCSIHDLPEGQIGKLQILKSGKLRLVLGECKFWLHEGVKVNSREELAIVKTDPETKTGDIISLGEIHKRIIVVPDILTKFES